MDCGGGGASQGNLEDTKDRPTYMHYVCPATWGHGCDLSFKLRDRILNFSLQTKQENEKSFIYNNDFFINIFFVILRRRKKRFN